eukprot:4370476-Prymnesium_polylepis.1
MDPSVGGPYALVAFGAVVLRCPRPVALEPSLQCVHSALHPSCGPPHPPMLPIPIPLACRPFCSIGRRACERCHDAQRHRKPSAALHGRARTRACQYCAFGPTGALLLDQTSPLARHVSRAAQRHRISSRQEERLAGVVNLPLSAEPAPQGTSAPPPPPPPPQQRPPQAPPPPPLVHVPTTKMNGG